MKFLTKTASQSPTKTAKKKKVEGTMNFYDALREVTAGKKITKLEWGDKNIYGFLKDTLLMLQKKDKTHQWIINEGDMTGTDWIVV